MGEHDLRCQARTERIGIELWIPFPRPDMLELIHPCLDVRFDHRLLGLFNSRQFMAVDVLQPAGKPRQCAGVLLDALPTEVLNQIIVSMNAVERRSRRMDFVEIGEIVVDEMMKWLGRTHH